jgi:hypothetical protein
MDILTTAECALGGWRSFEQTEKQQNIFPDMAIRYRPQLAVSILHNCPLLAVINEKKHRCCGDFAFSSEIKIKAYSMNFFLPESSDAELEKEAVDDPDTVTQCKAVVCHHSLYLQQEADDDIKTVALEQGHFHLLLKHPRQTCIGRDSNPGRLRRRHALWQKAIRTADTIALGTSTNSYIRRPEPLQ